MTTKKTWQGRKLKKKVKSVWWTGFVTKNGKGIAQIHKKISAVSVIVKYLGIVKYLHIFIG